MRSMSVISFTESGARLSEKLAELWGSREKEAPGDIEIGEIELYTKCNAPKGRGAETEPGQGAAGAARAVEESVGEWAGEQMRAGKILLFIGACGIAVRAVAPHLSDKLRDSPVLVADEKGNYVIPILSGHFGGANEIAVRIATMLGAVPVITTATDLNQKFAVDLFARRNGLFVVNREGIAKVSAKVLAGQEITMSVETGHFRGEGRLPSGVRMVPYPPGGPVDVLVTGEEKEPDAVLLLRPREYALGIGCRKGKEADKIEVFILQGAKEAGISPERFFAAASIDLKREEPGILQWSRRHRVPFLTYTAEELRETEGEFHGSAFVLRAAGVDNVCERAALRACGPGGRIVYGKHAADGMTIAVAEREWSAGFNEE